MSDSEVPVTVRRGAPGPLHLQIAGQLREAVRDGRLRSGHRLPSSRELARQLGVSRSVTQGAYDQLHAEGWIAGRVGAGTYVAELTPLARPPARRTNHHPPAGRKPLSLRPGIPYVDRRADPGWRRIWREVGSQPPGRGYEHPAGIPDLRAALAEHLGRVRGVACDPDQIVVTSGTAHGMRLLHAVIRRPGDRMGIEDPGYRNAVYAARDHRLEIVDCPVDADGLRVDELPADLAAVYVTPSHQYPLGGRLPVARRNALVGWARRTGALVLEDDYDSEFRFDVAPLPALAQLDLDRVVHLGTMSKTLTPALRLGWLVASEPVAEAVAAYRTTAGDWPAWPLQAAMLAMLRDGYLDRAVKRGRRRYAERCALVCDRLAPYGRIAGRDAGLHVTLLLPDGVDDETVADRARAAGLDVVTLSSFRRSTPGPDGLVIGYGAPTDDELIAALDLLIPILQDTAGTMNA
jgi:GntR family transcriptional regulator / MocR family aminotransferase